MDYMDYTDLIAYRCQIANFLGTDWVLLSADNGFKDQITNHKIVLTIHYEPSTKKLNIHGRPYPRDPQERNQFHEVLYQWIPREMYHTWTLSIGCSLKNPEKVANDIVRRLLPDVEAATAEIKRRIAINEANHETLRLLVEAFKQKCELPLRENRDNAERAPYWWNATLLTKDFHTLGEVRIDRETATCKVTLNGTSIETAAQLFKQHANGQEVIS